MTLNYFSSDSHLSSQSAVDLLIVFREKAIFSNCARAVCFVSDGNCEISSFVDRSMVGSLMVPFLTNVSINSSQKSWFFIRVSYLGRLMWKFNYHRAETLFLEKFKMKATNLINEFNLVTSQFQNTKNFLASSKKLGNLLLEEKEDFWKVQGELALSVLLAQFLSVCKDPCLEAFINFVNNLGLSVSKESLSDRVKERFRSEVERFLTQSPQTMRASIEVLQNAVKKVEM